MRESNIRWGILSTGRIARQLANDFTWVHDGELIAVASRDVNSARAFAAEYGMPVFHGSYQDLLQDGRVDAVYIATPHTLHLANTLAALQENKAVLCEKPLTVNAAECRRIIDASETGYVMEAMWTYFLPPIQKAREWIAAGRIGRLRQIKADFGYPIEYSPGRREWNKTLGGGCLLEMGIYPVALVWLFMGKPADNIAVSGTRADNGVESELSAILTYDDCIATIGTSFLSKLQNWAYLIGEDGYIAIPDFWRARSCHLYRLDEQIDSYIDDRQGEGFSFEIDAVNSDLLTGKKESDVMPLAASLAFQQEMERIKALI